MLKILARGGSVTTSYFPSHVLSQTTSRVIIDPTLQIHGYPSAFAMGDIIEWKEQKQAVKAMAQVPIVVHNILAVANGDTKSLKVYKGGLEWIALTLGTVSCVDSFTSEFMVVLTCLSTRQGGLGS